MFLDWRVRAGIAGLPAGDNTGHPRAAEEARLRACLHGDGRGAYLDQLAGLLDGVCAAAVSVRVAAFAAARRQEFRAAEVQL